MKKIYFLCTGNSCRSQMAEGYAKELFPSDKFEIKSAGVEKHGLNKNTVQVMAEDGVDISQQYSKLIDLNYFNSANLIVTLCGDARDKCPVIPPQATSIHWPLPDPAKATGTEKEKLQAFRKVRNKIKDNISELVQNYK